VQTGEIKAASGRIKWQQCLENHLVPAFGSFPMDKIRHADVHAWRVRMAEKINAGEYSPHTGTLGSTC